MSDALFSDRLPVRPAFEPPIPASLRVGSPSRRRLRPVELPGALAIVVLGGIVVGACLLAIAACFLPA